MQADSPKAQKQAKGIKPKLQLQSCRNTFYSHCDFVVKICKYIIKDSHHFTSLTSQMTIILILILYSIVRTSFKKQTIKRSYRCQCIQSTRGYFDLNQEKLNTSITYFNAARAFKAQYIFI